MLEFMLLLRKRRNDRRASQKVLSCEFKFKIDAANLIFRGLESHIQLSAPSQHEPKLVARKCVIPCVDGGQFVVGHHPTHHKILHTTEDGHSLPKPRHQSDLGRPDHVKRGCKMDEKP